MMAITIFMIKNQLKDDLIVNTVQHNIGNINVTYVRKYKEKILLFREAELQGIFKNGLLHQKDFPSMKVEFTEKRNYTLGCSNLCGGKLSIESASRASEGCIQLLWSSFT